MTLYLSLIITVLATLEWILIRRLRWRILRVLIQIPLLIFSFFLAWFLALYLSPDETESAQATISAQIIDISTVITGDLRLTISGTGAITPLRQIPLVFQSAAVPVTAILLPVGARVAEGDVIASLDATDLMQRVRDSELALNLQRSLYNALLTPPRPEDIAAAEAALASAQAQFNAAIQTGPTQAQREISRVQTEIARNQLWQSQLQRDAIAPPVRTVFDLPPIEFLEDIDKAVDSTLQGLNAANQAAYEAQLRQANAAVNQVEIGVDIADTNYDSLLNQGADPSALAAANAARTQAEINLERLRNGASLSDLENATLELRLAALAYEQSQLNLNQTQLIAPFDGLIAQMNLIEGELPPQGVSVLLIDDSVYYVEIPIDETDIAQVKIGQAVEFEVDALPNTPIMGRVMSIAYTPLDLEGLVAYNVRIELDPTTALIRAGMTVTASIITLERLNVLLVRNNFIRLNRQTGDAFVSVRDATGTIQERMILLGERGDVFSEVLLGLEVGEELVLLPRTD